MENELEIIRLLTEVLKATKEIEIKIRDKRQNALVYCAFLHYIPPIGSVMTIPNYMGGQTYLVQEINIVFPDYQKEVIELIVEEI